jgi:hypothetical protein
MSAAVKKKIAATQRARCAKTKEAIAAVVLAKANAGAKKAIRAKLRDK